MNKKILVLIGAAVIALPIIGLAQVSSSVRITSLSPKSGPVGTNVVINGKNFSTSSNDIYWDSEVLRTASSTDGKQLSFTVPSSTIGNHKVKVTNKDTGKTSASATFKVTALPEPIYPSVNIEYLTPDNGPVGTNVIIHGSGFSTSTATSTNNDIYWDSDVIGSAVSADSYVLSFAVPSSTSGKHNIKVKNKQSGKTSNNVKFEVASTTTTSTVPTIEVTSPNQGASWKIGKKEKIKVRSDVDPVAGTDKYGFALQLLSESKTLVQGIVSSTGKEYEWNVPSVAPGNYYIKAIQDTTGATDESGLFKIATSTSPNPTSTKPIKPVAASIYSVEPIDYVVRGGKYTFSGVVANAASKSEVYFSLKR
ncbi:IPT/TIG domain-containing protein, partial [Candidatus Wolfebacteria bacterium]|nr:IPT/TIG domain-containing protein [Candidatus Wolfebacteria bacterium]